MRLLLLILAASIHAADITVCASGCTTANFQTALTNAVRGDTITLTAGETFEGSFKLPYKGAGSGSVWVRSSRYAELPKPGNRVSSAHTSLMAKIQPSSTSVQAIYSVAEPKDVASIDIGTDIITFTGSHGFSDGEPVSVWYNDITTPTPIANNGSYFARDVTATTLKIALTPGGTAVDITASFSASGAAPRFRFQTEWTPSGWKFTGLEVAKKTGQDTLYALFEIGNSAVYSRKSIPSNFIVDRSYIHGVREEEGPNICLVINARNVTVADSEISSCVLQGSESKAIAMWQTPGPVLIRNNLLEAGSINVLTGGDYVPVANLVNGDEGLITIEGNLIRKPFWTKFTSGTSGAGVPASGCTTDPLLWYMRTSNGQWYYCTGGSSWTTGPTCVDDEYFRATDAGQGWKCASGVFATYAVTRGASYATKNLLELKSGENLLITGNIFEQNWAGGQDGTAVHWAAKVSQYNANTWVTLENIVATNNIIRNSTSGMRTATEGGTTFGVQNSRVNVFNNLLYKIGATDYPSISTTAPVPMSFAGPCVDCVFDHNTIVSGTTGGRGVSWDTAAFTRPRLSNSLINANLFGLFADSGLTVPDFWGSGNIINTAGVDNVPSQGAPGSFGAFATQGNWITAATALYTSSSDFRLLSTSPYSGKCTVGCAYTGTDGKDLGADIDTVEAATQGASSGLPWLGNSVQVTPGSTRAVVRYTAPSGTACNLTLYNDIGRVTENADTNTSGEKLDSRTGNITNGVYRQFVLGTNTVLTASTQYWAVIACGTSIGYASFRTLGAGSGYDAAIQYSSSRTGEYSSSADMSSPTAISSATTHTVPVPAASVRYYRATGGAIRVLVAGGSAAGGLTWAGLTNAWSTYTSAWSSL